MEVFISKVNKLRINEKIVAKSVRLIDESGGALGVVDLTTALQNARNAGLDLVEISPTASPPVCKIMDYGKHRYEEQRKLKEMKKKQKRVETKEIKLSPRIAIGDYNIKLRRAKEFIENGQKVKVSLAFRGREITHNEIGFEIVNRFRSDMEEFATAEVQPKMEGRQIVMVLVPS